MNNLILLYLFYFVIFIELKLKRVVSQLTTIKQNIDYI